MNSLKSLMKRRRVLVSGVVSIPTIFSAIAAAMVFVLLLGIRVAQGGPYIPPVGAPPVSMPFPPLAPMLGAPFTVPPQPPDTETLPVSTLWVIDICHRSFVAPGLPIDWPGTPNVVVVQNGIGADHLHFRLCQNFVPPLGFSAMWNVTVIFGAAPTALGNGYAFNLNSFDPFHTTPRIDDPIAGLPVGSFGFMIVLTDAGTVIDFLDPVLVTGTNLPPTVSTFTPPDHYKCYKVITKEGTPEFQQRDVFLTDQFEEKNTSVLEPDTICNPVDKNGEGIKEPDAHLKCYKIQDVQGQPEFLPQEVFVHNQFGDETLTVLEPETLCVPSFKALMPTQLQEEVCTDGIDNDGDGLADCDDADCNADSVCKVEEEGNKGGCAVAKAPINTGTATASVFLLFLPAVGIGLIWLIRRMKKTIS